MWRFLMDEKDITSNEIKIVKKYKKNLNFVPIYMRNYRILNMKIYKRWNEMSDFQQTSLLLILPVLNFVIMKNDWKQ